MLQTSVSHGYGNPLMRERAPSGVVQYAFKLPFGFSLNQMRTMPMPHRVLMTRPEEFDVVDGNNPHKIGHIGDGIDRSLAKEQWHLLKHQFQKVELSVETLRSSPKLEDMVFAANQALVGLNLSGEKICVPAQVKYPSKLKEVAFATKWFQNNGYKVSNLLERQRLFGGTVDAIWHPGVRLIWGGYGIRTDLEIFSELTQIFEAPVFALKLIDENFYHLDTCFSPLDRNRVLICKEAFCEQSLDLIYSVFNNVIDVDYDEAKNHMACNAASFFSRVIFLHKGATRTIERISDLGFEVVPVDTSEFLKFGGSVSCLKLAHY